MVKILQARLQQCVKREDLYNYMWAIFFSFRHVVNNLEERFCESKYAFWQVFFFLRLDLLLLGWVWQAHHGPISVLPSEAAKDRVLILVELLSIVSKMFLVF